MNVEEIMTAEPACCRATTPLPEVARRMIEHDCGCIPVLDESGKPIGVVTDRDITCRTVAEGKNPVELTARDCMSSPCVTVHEGDSIEACCETLERNQIRRVPVVDEEGICCGIVAQADLATRAEEKTTEVVRAVSRPSEAPSAVQAH